MAGCLRQIIPDRWASVKKHTIFHQMFFVVTRGVTKVRVSYTDRNCLAGV